MPDAMRPGRNWSADVDQFRPTATPEETSQQRIICIYCVSLDIYDRDADVLIYDGYSVCLTHYPDLRARLESREQPAQ